VHRNDDTTTRFSPTGPGLVRQSRRLADFSGAPTFAQQSSSTSRVLSSKRVAHAVIDSPKLSPHGILHEPCRPGSCGRDAPMFKGIFMANLKLLYDRVGGAAYQAYMRRNAVAVWTNDRRGSSFGLDWAGPFRAPTITAQASALDVLTTQIPALAGPASP